MKTCLILAACLTFAVCHGQEGQNQNDVLRRLDAIEKELKKGPHQLRWATVDRFKISTAVFAWSQEKLAQSRSAEALPPETEAKVQEYETLRTELLYKDTGIRLIPTRPLRRPAVLTVPGVTSPSAPPAPAPLTPSITPRPPVSMTPPVPLCRRFRQHLPVLHFHRFRPLKQIMNTKLSRNALLRPKPPSLKLLSDANDKPRNCAPSTLWRAWPPNTPRTVTMSSWIPVKR